MLILSLSSRANGTSLTSIDGGTARAALSNSAG
jgi:hypothetical protein